MPHRTTLWRRQTGKVSPKAKAGRNEGTDLSEANEILDHWRLTNILTLWVKTEWQTGNASQTIVTPTDFLQYVAVMLDLSQRVGDAPLAVAQVAFCDVAMAGRQRRGKPKKQSEILDTKSSVTDQKAKQLSARLKKDGYSDRDVKAAVASFRSEPSSPCWDALLAGSDAYTVTDPVGNKSNELGTIIRLKAGGCATHRIFPGIQRRMATYWRKNSTYKKVVAYLENIQRHGLPDGAAVSVGMAFRINQAMQIRMTELLIKLYKLRTRPASASRYRRCLA
jgi:hypothetical protein